MIPAERQGEETSILGIIRAGMNVPHFETVRIHKNGRSIDVSVTVSPIRDSAENVIGASKVVRDITARKLAEDRLGVSEARYRALFECAPDGILIADPRSYYLDANASMCEMLGYSREELIGLHASDIVASAEVRHIDQALDLIRAKADYHREWRFKRKDGSSFDAEVIASLLPDGNLLGMVRDITQRKRAAEELRLTHVRLQHLLENSPGVIYALKLEGERAIPYLVSENIKLLLGFDVEEALNREWWLGQLHPDDAGRAQKSLAETIATGTTRTEYRIRRKNGKYLWVDDNRRLVTDAQGKPAELVGVWTDITKRKQAELRLRLQHAVSRVLAEGASLERTHQGILETLGSGLGWELGEWWSVDRNAKVLRRTYIWHLPSTEFSEFGLASASMTFGKGDGLPGRVWASGLAEWSADIASDPGFTRKPIGGSLGLRGWIGFPILLRDEVMGVVGFFSSEVQEPDGDMLSTLGAIGSQIGLYIDKQQLEEQFRQAQKMDAIGTLAGGIAHDFNNILTVVTGYTDLMRMMVPDNPKLLECVEALGKAGSRATRLVRQILSFSRHDESRRENIQLRPAVEEAVGFLKASIPSSIEVTTDLLANLPNVLADSTQIHQIVMNLGTNAWHAMKEGPGRLEVRLDSVDVNEELGKMQLHVRPGMYVRLSVTDTGTGMDPATMGRIFEPFFTTKGPNEGTGLGLSVVHGIMKSHDGAVTVYSHPGKGTTFHLYFPAVGGEAHVLDAKGAEIPRGDGKRVLFVDDEEVILQLVDKMLTRLGYAVETRLRADEALELLRERAAEFDLVITDLTMPSMSGLEFAQKVARLRADLPIILTTGYPGSLRLEDLSAKGICDLLPKPPTMLSLGVAASRAINRKKAE